MNIKNDKEDIIFFKTNAFSEKWITVLEDGSVEIEGYASTKDVDSYYEIVDPEAFTEWLKRFEMNPVMLLQHNRDKPIWYYTKATITKQGLKVKWIVKHNTDWIIDQIKSWTMKWFSIWFRPTEYEYIEKVIDWQTVIVTIIKKLELREISVVSIPANPYTLFQAVGDYFKNITTENMKDIQTKDWAEQKMVFTQDEMLKAVELIRQEKAKKLEIVNEQKSDEVATAPVAVETIETETQDVAETIIADEKTAKTEVLDWVENVAGTATEVTQTEEKAASVEKSDEAKGIVISAEKMNLLLDVLENYKKNIDDLNAKVEKIGVSKWLTYTKTNESVEKKSVWNLDFINKTKVN